MDGFDRLGVWDDPAVGAALAWYRAVALNRRPAKFRIAATVAAGLDPAEAGEGALAAELERSWRLARALGVRFEAATFERRALFP